MQRAVAFTPFHLRQIAGGCAGNRQLDLAEGCQIQVWSEPPELMVAQAQRDRQPARGARGSVRRRR